VAGLGAAQPTPGPARTTVPPHDVSPEGILVLLSDGQPAAGIDVVEVPFDLEDRVRHRSDRDGLVATPPPARGACWIADARGFESSSVDRYRDAPPLQVLHLRAARTLRGRVVSIPHGNVDRYEWRACLVPAHVDPQVGALLRWSRRQEAVIDRGAFAIERAVPGPATLWVRCADRRGIRAVDWVSMPVAEEADDVTVDLGGGAFQDPFVDVDVRVSFPLAEPVGTFRVLLETEAGSRVPELLGQRAPGERTVVLVAPAVPVGTYCALLKTEGGQYRSEVADLRRSQTLELAVHEWTSLMVDATGWPTGVTEAAVFVGRRAVASVRPGQPARVRNLAAGRHEVTISGPGVAGGPLAVTLAAREAKVLTVALGGVHAVRVGLFPPAHANGEVRFAAEDGSLVTVPVTKGQRWVESSLPPGRYLATASLAGVETSARVDVVDRTVEVRLAVTGAR
jgi:hypothetical protein